MQGKVHQVPSWIDFIKLSNPLRPRRPLLDIFHQFLSKSLPTVQSVLRENVRWIVSEASSILGLSAECEAVLHIDSSKQFKLSIILDRPNRYCTRFLRWPALLKSPDQWCGKVLVQYTRNSYSTGCEKTIEYITQGLASVEGLTAYPIPS